MEEAQRPAAVPCWEVMRRGERGAGGGKGRVGGVWSPGLAGVGVGGQSSPAAPRGLPCWAFCVEPTVGRIGGQTQGNESPGLGVGGPHREPDKGTGHKVRHDACSRLPRGTRGTRPSRGAGGEVPAAAGRKARHGRATRTTRLSRCGL